MAVPKSLMKRKSKEKEQTLAELKFMSSSPFASKMSVSTNQLH